MPTEDDLRRASTDALLERHVGDPMQRITVEMLEVAAERIGTVLADLDDTEQRCRKQHYAECLCFALAARTRAVLTGEEST